MTHLSLLLCSSFLFLANFAQAGRVVMEGVSASGALFVSTTTGRVGISTNTPQETLDVRGTSLFTAAMTLNAGLTASSANFTASGSSQYSLALSSGLYAPTGTIVGNKFVGSGAELTGIATSVSTSTVYVNTPTTFITSVTVSASGGFKSTVGSFTATGANTFSVTTASGIQVLTGAITMGPGAFIRWFDGSISTSGNISGSGGGGGGSYTATNSTSVINIAEFSFANTSNGPCITGSTITMTTTKSRAFVDFSASWSNDTANSNIYAFLRRDGIDVMPEGRANLTADIATADAESDGSFSFLDTSLSSGTHAWCIAPRVSAGNGKLRVSVSTGNQFSITEIADTVESTRTLNMTEIAYGGSGDRFTIPGSTITMTITGTKVLLSLASVQTVPAVAGQQVDIIQDGVNIFTANRAALTHYTGTGNVPMATNMSVMVTGLAPGSHSWALKMYSGGTAGTLLNSGFHGNSWSAIEIATMTVASTGTINIPNAAFTNTAFNQPCIAFSTITMTTADSRVLVSYHSNFTIDTAGSIFMQLLRDGTPVLGSAANMSVGEESGSVQKSGNFNYLETGLAPGSHSWCVRTKVTAGTGNIQMDSGSSNNFSATELQR